MAYTLLDYPISFGAKPLHASPGIDAKIMGQNIIRDHVELLFSWRLDVTECDHSTEFVRAKSMQMSEFVGKGKVCPESPSGVYEYLVDNYELKV